MRMAALLSYLPLNGQSDQRQVWVGSCPSRPSLPMTSTADDPPGARPPALSPAPSQDWFEPFEFHAPPCLTEAARPGARFLPGTPSATHPPRRSISAPNHLCNDDAFQTARIKAAAPPVALDKNPRCRLAPLATPETRHRTLPRAPQGEPVQQKTRFHTKKRRCRALQRRFFIEQRRCTT